jgi:enoyl-CoA hydratase/carnithine racemase
MIDPGTDHVRYEIEDGTALITLDRPESGNAISIPMHKGLRTIWTDVRDNPDVRVAIITGAGDRFFCTGADMNRGANEGMKGEEGPLSDAVRLSPRQNRVWKPVICAVNGTVAGGGLHFVVDSDLVIAVDYAKFVDPHVNVGQVSGIESVGLTRRLPLGTALRMTLVGRDYRLTAQRAYELGLVDELATTESLLKTATEIAEQIKKNSPRAVSLSQQAMWGALEQGYSSAMAYGWTLVKLHRYHPDSAEGPKAFVERRPAEWMI